MVDADRDSRDDPQALGEALDHGGRDGAVADEQRVGAAGRGEHAGRRRGNGSAHHEPLRAEQIGALATRGLHRVNIHSRCRISNHWCILGSE